MITLKDLGSLERLEKSRAKIMRLNRETNASIFVCFKIGIAGVELVFTVVAFTIVF